MEPYEEAATSNYVPKSINPEIETLLYNQYVFAKKFNSYMLKHQLARALSSILEYPHPITLAECNKLPGFDEELFTFLYAILSLNFNQPQSSAATEAEDKKKEETQPEEEACGSQGHGARKEPKFKNITVGREVVLHVAVSQKETEGDDYPVPIIDAPSTNITLKIPRKLPPEIKLRIPMTIQLSAIDDDSE